MKTKSLGMSVREFLPYVKHGRKTHHVLVDTTTPMTGPWLTKKEKLKRASVHICFPTVAQDSQLSHVSVTMVSLPEWQHPQIVRLKKKSQFLPLHLSVWLVVGTGVVPTSSCIWILEYWSPVSRTCLERIKRHGLVYGGMSLGMGFWGFKSYAIPSCSLCLMLSG